MHYRADIDGLRAIAILLVLMYHGGLLLFPSGFVGVDVFFVISGFLITGIINHSIQSQEFSFLNFYSRRLWRLQPVLICFMLFAIILTVVFFLPDDLIEFSRSARKTSLYISNFFFNRTTTGYFSPDIKELPLLHTWSLSIEWQCYFILPWLIYGLAKIFKEKLLFGIWCILTVFAVLWSWHYSQLLPAQTYYQFSSRIFEFLIGASIALMPFSPLKLHPFLVNILGIAALSGILAVARCSEIALGYPNAYALIVCLATALLITLGRWYPTTGITKSLQWKPLVFLGLISYSLYLWHWLIFAVLRYQGLLESPTQLAMAYVCIFILSYLSWKYVEKPARRFNSVKFSATFLSLVLLPILSIHSIDYLLKRNSGYPQRFNEELVRVYDSLKQYNSSSRQLCISQNISEEEKIKSCTIGSKTTTAMKGLLIGDSFSNHYWGFVDTLAQDANISVLAQGTSSCLTLPGILHYDWWYFKNTIYTECRDNTENYYKMITKNHYDYVFIGQNWTNYLTDSIVNQVSDVRSLDLAKQRITLALEQAIKQISASGAQAVLLKSTALSHSKPLHCFYEHIKLRQIYNPQDCGFDTSDTTEEHWFNALFENMKKRYPQLLVIDPKLIQCPQNHCQVAFQGVPVFRDEIGHITDYASYQFAKQYLKEWGNPLRNSLQPLAKL